MAHVYVTPYWEDSVSFNEDKPEYKRYVDTYLYALNPAMHAVKMTISFYDLDGNKFEDLTVEQPVSGTKVYTVRISDIRFF